MNWGLVDVKVGWGLVKHHRGEPKPNGFTAGACFVRLRFEPATHRSTPQKRNGLLGIDCPGVFSVQGKDYGFDSAALPSGSKPVETTKADLPNVVRQLCEVVKSQCGLAEGTISSIELQTFPRVLGYVFNPVSFWYLNDNNGRCFAVVCEVNNTFGERHFYLLDSFNGPAVNRGGAFLAKKVFHVSPFFPVSGQYEFRFMDAESRTVARINYLEDDKILLKTSVSGELMTPTSRLWFRTLIKFGWFTVGVISKIHWQALKLLLKGAKFHRKPEPPQTILSNKQA